MSSGLPDLRDAYIRLTCDVILSDLLGIANPPGNVIVAMVVDRFGKLMRSN